MSQVNNNKNILCELSCFFTSFSAILKKEKKTAHSLFGYLLFITLCSLCFNTAINAAPYSAQNNRSIAPYTLISFNTSSNNQVYQIIHSLELTQHLILRASNAYFMVKSHSATPEVEETIKPLIEEISLIINNLPDDTKHLKTNALLKTLQNIWPELENRILSEVDDTVESDDPLNSVSVDTYAQSVIQTISTAIETLKEKYDVPTQSPLAILNQQTLLIRHISTNYAAIAAESDQLNLDLAQQKKSLQKLMITFRKQQSMLFDHYEKNSNVLKKLNAAQRSWQLIEKSLSDSSNNQVPFIVAKYSDDIVEDLSDALFILRN